MEQVNRRPYPGLAEVLDEIVGVLEANRQAHGFAR